MNPSRQPIPQLNPQELWNRIQNDVSQDKRLQQLLRRINKRVIIIDRLNQVAQIPVNHFQYNVATNVARSDEYILSGSLHSIGCHRGTCKGAMGIQKIRYSDPLDYRRLKIPRKEVKEHILVHLVNQIPQTSFIDVNRKSFRRNILYTIEDEPPHSTKVVKIAGNSRYSKEIDDMLTVALFLELKQMGKETYIQSCDKYRWMEDANLSNEQKRQVKENQLMPYFLSKEMMSEPALLLMGFECSYNCKKDQQTPHDEKCMLKTQKTDPVYE